MYVNGVSRKTANTRGTFANGKGRCKFVMGVQDGANSTHTQARIENVKLCANSSGSSYTNMTSSMGSYANYNVGNTSTNPYSISSKFPLRASLNRG